jgi:hypothetical protein
MKAVTVKAIKEELTELSPKELRELCLRLSKFKKENKELVTYLLFESSDEKSYIENIKIEADQLFAEINRKNYFLIRKSVRKILRNIRKYSRFSQKKETEVELLIYFCKKLKKLSPSIQRNIALQNLYLGQIASIRKKILSLHEDLQFDYESELKDMETGQ